MTTHRNHYVPQWYQKRFVKDPKAGLYYLDLIPERTILPSGEEVVLPALERNSPKKCFWSPDLYTTTFFGVANDEIEKFLFGAIDNDGANAVRAVAAGDVAHIHELFQRFFEYLDAQKLRTPKGLDWIRAHYPDLSQLELMLEMQHLRQMHSTMWVEGVREVVSAEKSDVKFIVTDHPVTVYHPEHPPGSPECAYPNDPDIALKGSQTLFPLGPDHCLILTNLEYAQNPDRNDLLEPRINARHFGRTLTRTDAWIRGRELSRDDVIGINRVLKLRARRFIAAAEESWLFPERAGVADWKTIGRLLLPGKDLWHFGGEIIVGYGDGKSAYQDAFGRTSHSHEYLLKERPKTCPAPEQPCGCGSGRAYEACCKDLSPQDRMPWNVYSIRERNLMLVNAIEDILGLKHGKTWEDVRRELSDDQVKRIHATYMALWPKDTDIANLLPRPDERVFRTVYVGLIDARTLGGSVLGWLPYFDEIVLLSPFVNAAFMRPEYSPIDSPEQFKEQTIKNVALLLALAPFIHAGVVHLVPDPTELNDTLREAVVAAAKERIGNPRLDPRDLRLAEELGKDDVKRSIARLPDADLRRQIRLSSPDISETDLTAVVQYIRDEHARDPLALNQPLVMGEEGGQVQLFKSINFELAMFLAHLTGSSVYTHQCVTKADLAAARNPRAGARAADPPTLERRLDLRLVIGGSPDDMMETRRSKVSETFRRAARSLWKAAISRLETADPAPLMDALGNLGLANAEVRASSEGAQPNDEKTTRAVFEIEAGVVIPPYGYGLHAVRRFLITFGRRRHIKAVPLAILFGAAVQPAESSFPR